MGGGAGSDKRGRYEEKGGGTWVGSLFGEDSDCERIKGVYGNYGLWAWLRYWYLDTENQVTAMMLDKGYHDYDYTEPKRKKRKLTEKEKELWSAEKMKGLLSRALLPKRKKPESDAERIQREILEDKKLRAESRNE